MIGLCWVSEESKVDLCIGLLGGRGAAVIMGTRRSPAYITYDLVYKHRYAT